MGTPEPAAKCLQALIDAQEQIVCVVTQPDRKKGRGLQSAPSPVKLLAQKYKIEVLAPEKAKDNIFIEKIKSLNPDLIVVVAFGKILPKEILDIPKKGTLNVHASLLPKYRGAAPVQWAILTGETKTGITIMRLDETLDTGDIIPQQEIKISPSDTYESLLDNIFDVGAQALLKAISQITSGTAKYLPQNNHDATYAPQIIKEAGVIDWRKSAKEINNQIRAFIPWPVAHTFVQGKILKIWEAEIIPKEKHSVPGEIFITKNGISVSCGENALLLKTVQLEGGKKLPSADFARGHNLTSKKILPS